VHRGSERSALTIERTRGPATFEAAGSSRHAVRALRGHRHRPATFEAAGSSRLQDPVDLQPLRCPATFEAAGSSKRQPRVGHGPPLASRHLRGGGFIEAEQERYALLGYLRGPGTFEAAGSSGHTDA